DEPRQTRSRSTSQWESRCRTPWLHIWFSRRPSGEVWAGTWESEIRNSKLETKLEAAAGNSQSLVCYAIFHFRFSIFAFRFSLFGFRFSIFRHWQDEIQDHNDP